MSGAPAGFRGRAALVALALQLTGCSGALYSEFDFRTGQPVRNGSLAAAWAAGAPDAATAGAPASKAAVLAALGPPGEVLPLDNGDVFVYRLRLTDVDVLNLNTSIFTGIVVPIYARIEGRQRDDVLYVQFNAAGRVTAVSEAAP